jgi:hypothetical protein
MTPDDFSAPPVLRRLRLWKPGSIGGTMGIIAAHRGSWAFRQKPVPSHDQPNSWGFEVETLMLPSEALLALEATGEKGWRVTELWSRPARPGEGEGPWRETPITASKRKMDEVVNGKRRPEDRSG